MSAFEKIKRQIRTLSRPEQQALFDWLENVLEDQLELTEEFKAEIERGERDIHEGRVRIRKA